MKKSVLATVLLCVSVLLNAQKFTISGHIVDANTSEDLIGATIVAKNLTQGTATNVYGFYSLTIEKGKHTIEFSYVGYASLIKEVDLVSNVTLNIKLVSDSKEIEAVEVTSERKNKNVVSTEMSVAKLETKSIRSIPALMGEVDVVKAIQMLPGVQSISEGSSGYSVRGGAADQNLIILDEATVYNASHLLGFFSVFNNDAVKDVTLYKGDIPAEYGGRLSSLLDIRMKNGNMREYHGTGGIGTISSRLTLEGPIIKDRTSFLISGRRTYADVLFLPFARNEFVRESRLYFYDLNLKLNHIIDENNRIFVSSYFGRDYYRNQFANMGFGNRTLTARWNHLFSKRLFSNLTLIGAQYDYSLGTPEGSASSFLWESKMLEYSMRYDFTYYLNSSNTINYGFQSSHFTLDQGEAGGVGDESIFTKIVMPKFYALNHAVFISNTQTLTSWLSVKYGLRYSLYQNIGPGTIYNIDDNYVASDSNVYARNKIFNTFGGIEPRLGATFIIDQKQSIKTSYARNRQYLHLAQNSTAGTPLDIWLTSTPNVKPQYSDQFALGYFRNFLNNKVETSVEVYYKKMYNSIDFKDFANLLLNQKVEAELRFGKANSYGAEFFIKMNADKLNGWIAYTLSKTERQIEGINNGKKYAAPYDKPHVVSVVLNYAISRKFSVSANWTYATGNPVTFPVGRGEYYGTVFPIYSDRNAYRMPDYHRLDLGITYIRKPIKSKFYGEWVFSIYNAYNRHNSWAINFQPDKYDPSRLEAQSTYLFPILPSITYNFHF